jgi:xylulokinase
VGSVFCGIDIGTTNIKVLLVDDEAKSLWVKSAPTPRVSDGFGVVTDGRALVAALEDMIISGWREVGGGRAISAIATAGVGEDGFCVDDAFQPLSAAIPWCDHRDKAEAVELDAQDMARQYPAINFAFATAASKWLWLSRHRPQHLPKDRTWITLTDFPIAWWSAQAFISETLLARTGVFDVLTRRIVPELERIAASPRLPKSSVAGSAIGTLRSGPLRESGAANSQTMLVAGGHDHPVASSVILRIAAEARVDSIGTANMVYGETHLSLESARGCGLDLSLPVRGGPGLSAMGPIAFTERLLAQFGTESRVREIIEKGIGGAGVDDDSKKLRQLIQTMSIEARDYFGRMAKIGVKPGPIFATGGWSRSRALMQLRASIYSETVTTIDEPELTALGAALFAMQAVEKTVPVVMRGRHVAVVYPS